MTAIDKIYKEVEPYNFGRESSFTYDKKLELFLLSALENAKTTIGQREGLVVRAFIADIFHGFGQLPNPYYWAEQIEETMNFRLHWSELVEVAKELELFDVKTNFEFINDKESAHFLINNFEIIKPSTIAKICTDFIVLELNLSVNIIFDTIKKNVEYYDWMEIKEELNQGDYFVVGLVKCGLMDSSFIG